MRRIALSHRLQTVVFVLVAMLFLVGCGLNKEKGVPTVIVFVPTNTLSPDNGAVTDTPTIIPTATTIPPPTTLPTNPVLATTAVPLPTATPTAVTMGSVSGNT